jgi:hypothetical protein
MRKVTHVIASGLLLTMATMAGAQDAPTTAAPAAPAAPETPTPAPSTIADVPADVQQDLACWLTAVALGAQAHSARNAQEAAQQGAVMAFHLGRLRARFSQEEIAAHAQAFFANPRILESVPSYVPGCNTSRDDFSSTLSAVYGQFERRARQQ